MTKTTLTKTKQNQLMQYLFKYVQQIRPDLNIESVKEKISKDLTNILDTAITQFFGDEIFTRNKWLSESLGVRYGVKEDFVDHNREDNNPLGIDFSVINVESSLKVPDPWFDRLPENDITEREPMSCYRYCRKQLEKHKFYETWKQNVATFRMRFYSFARPFIKLILESKNCEELYEVWKDDEVYKICFPQKTYAIATLSDDDINFIKDVVNKHKKEEK